MVYAQMSAPDFVGKVDDGGIILDVRTKMEHNEKHLNMPHQHVPLDQLHPDQFAKDHGLNHNSPIYILCKAGMRAKKAADMFVAAGYKNIICIEGGLDACLDCGHVANSASCGAGGGMGGKMSLERQVRVAAGLCVALGAYLALAVHANFAYVPLAVGLGLVFAGVTNRCGLALLLTKAPWNK